MKGAAIRRESSTSRYREWIWRMPPGKEGVPRAMISHVAHVKQNVLIHINFLSRQT